MSTPQEWTALRESIANCAEVAWRPRDADELMAAVDRYVATLRAELLNQWEYYNHAEHCRKRLAA